MYPHMAALSGAREIRVPLAEGWVHDLDAMLAELTVATQIVVVCNPNNPTGTYLPAERIGAFVEAVPNHVTVIVDEAYIEFQAVDHPDATIDLLARHPNLVLLRTFSNVYGLCSPQLRAAMDAVRQPFSVNLIAQAAAAEAILHQDDVSDRVEKNIVERMFVEEQLSGLGLEVAYSQANFVWVGLGDRDEDEVVGALTKAGVAVRPGAALGAPGNLRVTYGTRAENERFIGAMAGAI